MTVEFFCPACGGTRATVLGRKNDLYLSKCGVCGTISIQSPHRSEEVVFDYHHYYRQARFEDDPAVARSIQSLIDSFSPFRKTGRLLDVGFGEGGLLRSAEKQGWSCFGAEVSSDAIEYGKIRGWIVSSTPDSDPLFPAGGFDVVTMIEFIEHAPDPTQYIKLAYRLLRPGGALYLTTPNARSLNARVLGINWSVLAPPEHAIIWSPAGLSKALRQAGFTVRATRTDGLNPVEIIAHYRNRRVSAHGERSTVINGNPEADGERQSGTEVDRNKAAFALNTALSSSPWRRAVKRGINSGLTTLRIGDSLKVLAQKAGPEINDPQPKPSVTVAEDPPADHRANCVSAQRPNSQEPDCEGAKGLETRIR